MVEPLTVEVAAADPRVRSLASRSIFNIGSYLGVPVMLRTGQPFGTLCVLDPEPHHFGAEDLDLLIIVSAWLRLCLECERLTGRTVFDAE